MPSLADLGLSVVSSLIRQKLHFVPHGSAWIGASRTYCVPTRVVSWQDAIDAAAMILHFVAILGQLRIHQPEARLSSVAIYPYLGNPAFSTSALLHVATLPTSALLYLASLAASVPFRIQIDIPHAAHQCKPAPSLGKLASFALPRASTSATRMQRLWMLKS
ncbi:hypothetical protein BCR44DRAFT_60350 [Catenaria anguillulae PL171]|uniref:Uncharacterized protein n=1 Tax=Catenaria anguillulae PL171 TaxID=765915 RepID=A0A1Y2I4N7_9FUNG|nr:hypothetical protein BCR44DRAFT_60350 [Catenaria anguillulae PL171]